MRNLPYYSTILKRMEDTLTESGEFARSLYNVWMDREYTRPSTDEEFDREFNRHVEEMQWIFRTRKH